MCDFTPTCMCMSTLSVLVSFSLSREHLALSEATGLSIEPVSVIPHS